MSADPAKYVLAKSTSRYFAELLAQPDTRIAPEDAIRPDDTDDVVTAKKARIIGKLERKLARATAIAAGIREGWFAIFESVLMSQARALEQSRIWEALDSGDEEQILVCRAEHAGLLALFETLHTLGHSIEPLRQRIAAVADSDDIIELTKLLEGVV